MGPNSHPTAKMYAQIHRLLTLYSLVQPPKGSNVSGVGNLKSLVTAQDLVAESSVPLPNSERKQQVQAMSFRR